MTSNNSSGIPPNPEHEFFRSSVRQIRDLTSLPEKHFAMFYENPLERFLLLSRFAKVASIKNHFDSVINALKLRRSITLPINTSAENIHGQKDVWTYAIFIGALIYESTSLFSSKVVYKAQSSAHYFRWTPFDGPLKDKVNAQVLGNLRISNSACLVFLPLVFDSNCLAWIFRHTEVFNTAVELAISPDPNTEPGRIILESHSYKSGSEISQTNPDEEKQIPKIEEPSSENEEIDDISPERLTKNFMEWMFEASTKRHNRKYFCLTTEGLAVSDPGIFQHYASLIKYSDWQNLRSDILSNIPYKECPYQVQFNSTAKTTALLFSDSTPV